MKRLKRLVPIFLLALLTISFPSLLISGSEQSLDITRFSVNYRDFSLKTGYNYIKVKYTLEVSKPVVLKHRHDKIDGLTLQFQSYQINFSLPQGQYYYEDQYPSRLRFNPVGHLFKVIYMFEDIETGEFCTVKAQRLFFTPFEFIIIWFSLLISLGLILMKSGLKIGIKKKEMKEDGEN